MIGFIIRWAVFLALVVAGILIAKRLFKPTKFIPCDRCNGKGFWMGSRGRETCDKCRGVGRFEKN